jgi:hypothetical protein
VSSAVRVLVVKRFFGAHPAGLHYVGVQQMLLKFLSDNHQSLEVTSDSAKEQVRWIVYLRCTSLGRILGFGRSLNSGFFVSACPRLKGERVG